MTSDDREKRLAGLMRSALTGDETAYAAFLREAADLVRRAVARRIGHRADVAPEDVVQETLLALHLKRHTWRQDQPILPWLYSIARYKAIDAYRRRGVRVELPVDDFAGVLAAPDNTHEMEDAQHIEVAVSSLSDGQRKVVRAIAIEGRSIKETAAALRMREGAVRVAFHRGLTAIAARLGRQT